LPAGLIVFITASVLSGNSHPYWPRLDSGNSDMPNTNDPDQNPIPASQKVQPPQRTVLNVEDNPANMLLVAQLIARRGDLKMVSAVDGSVGIMMARVHQPAAILMDINLRGIGGFDALKILLDDPSTAHIPVIAVSSNSFPRDIAKGIEAGFFRYLTKPFKVTELMDAIDAALDNCGKK
jgi:CheY-like chemotaxis protein